MISLKIIAKPIEVIAVFNEMGIPTPIKFRIKNNDSTTSVIKIDSILFKENEKLAGNNMIIFRCQSIVLGTQKIFELKYELNTCKWMLYKM